ncbi:BFR2 Protein BFR2 [Candida maltosa Xu316]|uniref:Protein BFR2 n=1 Tax=Candida maltosa (strain Xu316) TaxID=1245528 RepID=M3K365_CANMX|nr:Brefeldin a resistance protein, putative [Candida maltosa Xu316]
MAKKSLAEQISSFYTPKADYDIEDHELDGVKDDVFEHNDVEDESEEDTELRNEHYVNAPKSKLRSESINLGEKYVGNVIDRNNLYDDGEEDEGEIDEEEEEVEGDEENDNEEEVEEDDLSEEDDDEEDDVEESSSHKRELLKSLMSKERSHIVNRLSQSATNDALKGYAIQQQVKVFEKVIDVRLKFQKSVNASNLLPINQESYHQVKTDDSDKLLSQTKKELFQLLDHLLHLRNEIEEDSISPPKKRSFEKYSEITEKADLKLNSHRNQVLTKWSAKVTNSSGSNAMNASKFKSINQSFEQQVKNNLSDMDRLIKRTKLNRRNVTPIGYKEDQEQDKTDKEEDDDDIPEEAVVRRKTQGLENKFIFDDEDFYRVLLNDLVDKKVQGSDPTTGITISLRSAQKVNKLKNNVDTKASKGRKLRYHVQEPIANFESSVGKWKWNDDQIDEFFASLLGQKVNMNEVDEEEEGEEADDIIPEDNGIQLFG